MNGDDAEEEPLRALSDIRQRFPQWHIGQSGDGWHATPRATWSVDASTLEGLYERLEREEDRREGASRDEPGCGEASLPGIPPRFPPEISPRIPPEISPRILPRILPRPRQAPP